MALPQSSAALTGREPDQRVLEYQERAPMLYPVPLAMLAGFDIDAHPTPTPAAIDDALADSFPASDPPPWVPGVARIAPRPAVPTTGGGIWKMIRELIGFTPVDS